MNINRINMALSALAATAMLAACGGESGGNGGRDDKAELNALNKRLETVDLRLARADAENTDLPARLDSIAARLEELQSESEISDELDALSERLDAVEARVALAENDALSHYRITVTNVTANQPLAPAALILHDAAYSAWSLGSPASSGLEQLAESGSPAYLLEDARTDAVDSTDVGTAPFAPGAAMTTLVAGEWQEDLSLTIASMPVNTNDAFTGVAGWHIAGLEPGESATALLRVYDAGTEANSETSESVPGPAAGGEGYNAARDDLIDAVTLHRGVVTADDGLASSALNASHRFDQGAMYIRVTRID